MYTLLFRTTQQLNHPNVVCYIHSFVENRELQIVLELADAGDLAQLLRHCQRRHQLLVEKTIWRYFVQLCSALEHMHGKRIMHRGNRVSDYFFSLFELQVTRAELIRSHA